MADQTLIRAILDAIAADPHLLTQIRADKNKMAGEIALNPARGREILSGSGNGQSYSVSQTMTYMERLKLLQAVISHYDSGTKPGRYAPLVIT